LQLELRHDLTSVVEVSELSTASHPDGLRQSSLPFNINEHTAGKSLLSFAREMANPKNAVRRAKSRRTE
jgi:hypothetical protein